MIVSPSILAADFNNLDQEMNKINNSICEFVHLDVMDGKFVPNTTFDFFSSITNPTTVEEPVMTETVAETVVEEPTTEETFSNQCTVYCFLVYL